VYEKPFHFFISISPNCTRSALYRSTFRDTANGFTKSPRSALAPSVARRKSRFAIRAQAETQSSKARMECHEIYTTVYSGTSSRWINNTNWHPAPFICLSLPVFSRPRLPHPRIDSRSRAVLEDSPDDEFPIFDHLPAMYISDVRCALHSASRSGNVGKIARREPQLGLLFRQFAEIRFNFRLEGPISSSSSIASTYLPPECFTVRDSFLSNSRISKQGAVFHLNRRARHSLSRKGTIQDNKRETSRGSSERRRITYREERSKGEWLE